jgi:hypothetical protein
MTYNIDEDIENADWIKTITRKREVKEMAIKIIKSEKELPAGAVRIHMYNVEKILRPRGPMEKESLSRGIYEKLCSVWDSWTDPVYGDNPPKVELLELIKRNLEQEVRSGMVAFMEKIKREEVEA